MLSRRSILGGSLNYLIARRITAQQLVTFSAEVNVVNILATVRDQNGQLIQDLSKDDFSVFEDGHQQAIRYFASKTELPLTIALLVDTSLSQQRLLEAESHTVAQFLKNVLRPDRDTSLIVRFDHDIRILQDLSSVPIVTDAMLENLTNPKYRTGGGTHLYSAVYLICRQKLAFQHGRKVMLILSDGVDAGSKAKIADAEDEAIKNDVVVYTILFSDPLSYVGYSDYNAPAKGAAILKSMAQVSGGSFFEPSKERGIGQIFNLPAEDLRGQYSIGYVSDQPATKSKVRKVTLTTHRPEMVVQSRKWYFVQKPRR